MHAMLTTITIKEHDTSPISLSCFVVMSVKMLYCSYVWMAPGKLSCKCIGLQSVNIIPYTHLILICVYKLQEVLI